MSDSDPAGLGVVVPPEDDIYGALMT